MMRAEAEAAPQDGDLLPCGRRPAIRCNGVTKRYSEKVAVLDIDLEIPAGETFCLVGRNGSGKSTLIELIKGLRAPSAGDISVFGSSPGDPAMKSRCALLMDRPVYPYYAKIEELIALYGAAYANRIDAGPMLSRLQLDPDKCIRHLSRGQAQRLGLLLTLIGDPDLILLDEPASGLDPQGRELLWELVRSWKRRSADHTLVFATHDLMEAEHRSERIGVMHEGRLLTADGWESLRERYIGTRKKLTLAGALSEKQNAPLIEELPSVQLGSELAVYTEHPEALLKENWFDRGAALVRIDDVSLRDVYFRLTGVDICGSTDAHGRAA